MTKAIRLDKRQARRIWIKAQRLDVREPFGDGPVATRLAVEHLGYVQIDTINVIERSHHHILYSRIPGYDRAHLHQAQSIDKSVFEYWTHALAYVPVRDYRYFVGAMKRHRQSPGPWSRSVTTKDLRKVLALVRKNGAVTIRDIDDDVLVEKDRAWASRKPSKRALQLAFHRGHVTVSGRIGMLKAYDLTERHFGWEKPPKAATEPETLNYLLDRALRTQGLVSLDSVCHLDAKRKAAVRHLVDGRVRRKTLAPVAVGGVEAVEHWIEPGIYDAMASQEPELVHLLSPFDPLTFQRKRLQLLFDYEHRFEAYVPRDKRKFGYFALPVLCGDEIVAVIDLKADRQRRKLLVQKWTWVGRGSARRSKRTVEEELHRFERFQLPG